MAYECKILLDSMAPSGCRLTTFQVTFPRIILAEFNTHRLLSRSSASSRAIPVEKRIAAVEADPFIPEEFGRNQKGMQAGEALTGTAAKMSRERWTEALRDAVFHASRLAGLGVHKQLANRLIEPFSWHTVICSATTWTNFFGLRDSPMAQPEMQSIARMMREAYEASQPQALRVGDWHMPMVTSEDDKDSFACDNCCGHGCEDGQCRPFRASIFRKLSVARCARVSYLTHDGRRAPEEDIALHDKLAADGHWSPFEHVAMALDEPRQSGNFTGWMQYRKMFANEHIGGRRMNGTE